MSERFLMIQFVLTEFAIVAERRHIRDNGLAASTFTDNELTTDRTGQISEENVLLAFAMVYLTMRFELILRPANSYQSYTHPKVWVTFLSDRIHRSLAAENLSCLTCAYCTGEIPLL